MQQHDPSFTPSSGGLLDQSSSSVQRGGGGVASYRPGDYLPHAWPGAYAAYRSPYVDVGVTAYGQGSQGSPLGVGSSLSSCALNAAGGFGFSSSGVMPVGGQFVGGYHRLHGAKEYCGSDYANLQQSAGSLTYRHVIQ